MYNQPVDKPIPRWRDKLPVTLLIIWLLVQGGLVAYLEFGFKEFLFGDPNKIVLDGVQYEFKEATVFDCRPSYDIPILPCRRMVVEQCYVDGDECDIVICWECVAMFISDDGERIMARKEDGSVTQIHRILP